MSLLKRPMVKTGRISIPTPCHEDWNLMIPNSEGSYCKSCSKTVTDFTDKTPEEIRIYFKENSAKVVCGRFRSSQLDSITIEIPKRFIYRQTSISKMFLIAFLIVMGSSLLSCDIGGKKQKIEKVIVVDSLKNPKPIIDSVQSLKQTIKTNDSFIAPPPSLPEIENIVGLVLKEDEELIDEAIPIDSIVEAEDIAEEPPFLIGKVKAPPVNEEIIFGLVHETSPKFENYTNNDTLNSKEAFMREFQTYINANFNLSLFSDLPKGKYKIYNRFVINEKGQIEGIKVRTSFKKVEVHITEILNKLPQFIPGTQRGLPVKVIYTLPIIFRIE